MTAEGLITRASRTGPRETAERLAAAVTRRGMAVLARIDHAAAAEKVGLALRPTELVIFGSPKAGTPLMQAAQTIGIELPLRALVWQDAAGKTWLAYTDPHELARRHGVDPRGLEQTLAAMTQALAAVAEEATGPA
ncbi:MAG TPA: DUF302 domain-containing protein [Myxococcota bacterium]|nr:DUF302 domain-containing protein [Myxococcota bacterium]